MSETDSITRHQLSSPAGLDDTVYFDKTIADKLLRITAVGNDRGVFEKLAEPDRITGYVDCLFFHLM